MCNRVVRKDKVIKPGERLLVLLKGPGAEFELPFTEAVFAGPAKVLAHGHSSTPHPSQADISCATRLRPQPVRGGEGKIASARRKSSCRTSGGITHP